MSFLLARAAELFGDVPFLIEGEETWSFADVEAIVDGRVPTQDALAPRVNAESVLDILSAIRHEGGCVLFDPGWAYPLRRQRLDSVEVGEGTTLFTSGSSGHPKAVTLSEANWQSAASISSEFFRFGPKKSWLLALPLFHVSGLSIVFRALWSGGAVLFSPGLDRMGEATIASMVPTQLARVVERSPGDLEAVLIGGGRLPDHLRVERWPLVQTYGMTETAAIVASANPDDGLGSMFPLPGLEIKGTVDGRLAVRGDQVSNHLRDEEGWYVTADLGRVELDGSIAISGRVDRVINCGGEKIDPSEIEAVLLALPGVDEAVVFGAPDPEWGEVVAIVFSGIAPESALDEVVAAQLGRKAVPRITRRMDRLPRTALGKPDLAQIWSLTPGLQEIRLMNPGTRD